MRPGSAGGGNVVGEHPETLCQHDALWLRQPSRQGRSHQQQLGRDRKAVIVMALDFSVPTERAKTAGHIVVFALSLKFCGSHPVRGDARFRIETDGDVDDAPGLTFLACSDLLTILWSLMRTDAPAQRAGARQAEYQVSARRDLRQP